MKFSIGIHASINTAAIKIKFSFPIFGENKSHIDPKSIKIESSETSEIWGLHGVENCRSYKQKGQKWIW